MSQIDAIVSGLRLKIIEGSHQEALHSLTRTAVSIGRSTPETPSSESYLTFPEPTLSRLHALLTWVPLSKTYLAHHKSQTNPTLLNGRPLTSSELLKPGDILALGRLVAVLELDDSRPIPTPPLAPEAPPLTLHLKSKQNENDYCIPITHSVVNVCFTQDRRTAAMVAEDPSQGIQSVNIPGEINNTLRFQIDFSTEQVRVETARTEACETGRRRQLAYGVLYVPLKAGQAMPFQKKDVLLHQGYQIWLEGERRSETSEGSPEDLPIGDPRTEESLGGGGQLHFLNGAWKGACLTLPADKSIVFDLGAGSGPFGPELALPDSPSCQLAVQNGQCQLRVKRLTEEQFVDVNGELFLVGEATTLPSGSQILLGESEFLWILPDLHSEYSRYQIVAPDGTHPIRKAEVRLGTAAHCEVRFQIRALAPVVGRLRYQDSTLFYQHSNIAEAAKVDGIETSAGLEAKVFAGSKLELAPGVSVSVQEIDKSG